MHRLNTVSASLIAVSSIARCRAVRRVQCARIAHVDRDTRRGQPAQSFSWTGNTSKAWKSAGNWTPAGGTANAIDAAAIFNVGTTGITAP